MKQLHSWKTIAGLLALVVISGLAGILLGHRFARLKIEARNNPETWNQHVTREFNRRVAPTPEQSAHFQILLAQAVRELQGIRLETIARSTNVIWKLVADVEKELKPEQLKAFQALKPKPADLTLDLLDLEPKKKDTKSPKTQP